MPDYNFVMNWDNYPMFQGQTRDEYYNYRYNLWVNERSGRNPDGTLKLSPNYSSHLDSTNSGGRRMRYKSTRRRGKTNRRRGKTHRRRHRKH